MIRGQGYNLDDAEYLMERAAIRQYDGEQSEEEARQGALEDLRKQREKGHGHQRSDKRGPRGRR